MITAGTQVQLLEYKAQLSEVNYCSKFSTEWFLLNQRQCACIFVLVYVSLCLLYGIVEANMLYLETPAGVGFSYSTDSSTMTMNDEITGMNHTFSFFVNLFFPFYVSHELVFTKQNMNSELERQKRKDIQAYPSFENLERGYAFIQRSNFEQPLINHIIMKDCSFSSADFKNVVQLSTLIRRVKKSYIALKLCLF